MSLPLPQSHKTAEISQLGINYGDDVLLLAMVTSPTVLPLRDVCRVLLLPCEQQLHMILRVPWLKSIQRLYGTWLTSYTHLISKEVKTTVCYHRWGLSKIPCATGMCVSNVVQGDPPGLLDKGDHVTEARSARYRHRKTKHNDKGGFGRFGTRVVLDHCATLVFAAHMNVSASTVTSMQPSSRRDWPRAATKEESMSRARRTISARRGFRRILHGRPRSANYATCHSQPPLTYRSRQKTSQVPPRTEKATLAGRGAREESEQKETAIRSSSRRCRSRLSKVRLVPRISQLRS